MKQTVEQFIKDKCGSVYGINIISVVDEETLKNQYDEDSEIKYKEGDIGIYYDYCEDELTEEQCEHISEESDKQLEMVTELLQNNGYNLTDHIDGSGNGMVYGLILFRK